MVGRTFAYLSCVLLLPIAIACGDDAAPGGAGGAGGMDCMEDCGGSGGAPQVQLSCAEGLFERSTSDPGCTPVAADADTCPPGTRARIGDTQCVPVGIETCAPGMELAPHGWGCVPILPTTPCTGATMAVLGETVCQPIGDCNAPFPPASAAIFVDDDYTAAELDATHFNTFLDAVAAASAGDVIAIESGSYIAQFGIGKELTVVGRCAEQVEIGSVDGATPALFFAAEVTLRGLTFRGHDGALASLNGVNVNIEECLITENTRAGVLASGANSSARIVDSVIENTVTDANGAQAHGAFAQNGGRIEIIGSEIRSNEFTNIAVSSMDSVGIVDSSVVRDGFPQTAGAAVGLLGVGILAQDGGSVTVNRTAVFDNYAQGILINTLPGESPGSGSIVDSYIGSTRFNPASNAGFGIEVDGGPATISRTTVVDNEDHAMLVTEGGSAEIDSSVVIGPSQALTGQNVRQPSGAGIVVGDDGDATVTNTAFVGNRTVAFQVETNSTATIAASLFQQTFPALEPPEGTNALFGFALQSRSGSSVTGEDLTMVRNRLTSLFVDDASFVGDRILISDTSPNAYSGRAASAQEGGVLDLTRSALLSSAEVGLFLIDPMTRVSLTDSVIDGVVEAPDGVLGVGTIIATGAELVLDRTSIRNNQRIGIATDGASALVKQCLIAGNAVAVHTQNGSSLQELDASSPQELSLIVTPDTLIVGNEAKVGTGIIPLPVAIGPVP